MKNKILNFTFVLISLFLLFGCSESSDKESILNRSELYFAIEGRTLNGDNDDGDDTTIIYDSCWLTYNAVDRYSTFIFEVVGDPEYIKGDCDPYGIGQFKVNVNVIENISGVKYTNKHVFLDSNYANNVSEGDIMIATSRYLSGDFHSIETAKIYFDREIYLEEYEHSSIVNLPLSLSELVNSINEHQVNYESLCEIPRGSESDFRKLIIDTPDCVIRNREGFDNSNNAQNECPECD